MADKASLSGARLPADATAPEQSARRGQLAAPWSVDTTATNDTVAIGEALWVDASGAGTAGLSIALPSSPTSGQRVLIGKADAVAANPVYIVGKVNGDTDGGRIITPGVAVTLQYVNTALGWRAEAIYPGTANTVAMPYETGTSHWSYLAQTQTIPTGVDRVVWFPTVGRPSALVDNVAYSTGTKFVLKRSGLWMGTTTVRVPLASSGECYVAWCEINPNQILGAQGGAFGGLPGTRTVPLFDYFSAGDEVYVNVYQSAGADRNIDHNNGQWASVRLGWVHD